MHTITHPSLRAKRGNPAVQLRVAQKLGLDRHVANAPRDDGDYMVRRRKTFYSTLTKTTPEASKTRIKHD